MATSLFDELKAKYPRAHKAPDADCPRCQGTGQRPAPINAHLFPDGKMPCPCLFMTQDLANELVDIIRKVRSEASNG